MADKLTNKKIVALSGGVGGAKLALGLSELLAPENLSIIVNTADDFEHLGFPISPDIDTLLYTLAGISNQQQGWGIEGETWSFMQALAALGEPTWFQLGDKDIATHTLRRELLSQGKSLTEVTAQFAKGLGVKPAILPMTNSPVATFVASNEGELAFQEYFVKRQCQPEITAIRFAGIEQAEISPSVTAAISEADAIICCPSNPFVSIAPILSLPKLKASMIKRGIPVIVVSPIIAGKAVKGPAAKMMQELKLPVTQASVASFYQGFASHFVIDSSDQEQATMVEQQGFKCHVCNTLMQSIDDKKQLARDVLSLIA
jgi:LPPG:FO 2-phospho-L-lactate transferase